MFDERTAVGFLNHCEEGKRHGLPGEMSSKAFEVIVTPLQVL